ncbi:DNA polymerase IV [Planctomycetes bacterium K23_9]|uniref:DNA polymerase IV n=1 Tax=Stieleria marina TaxID=1930275 RepID=A0A517NQM2_9BACT|nr:DNA polymerase IV [Planctomycetes bacterium K23_9]
MILHIDMDAFYAAIEQRDQPELRGKPVVVGGSKTGRGVVAAASYEARRFGIHSAMPGRRAAQLCPDAIFVRGRIDHYAAVGRQVREIFHRYTPLVQPLSLDEAFLDVTGSARLHGDGVTIGHAIKQAIAKELNLVASVGVAPLKFVAKIASDLEKPNGFVVVRPDDVIAFLDPLPIKRLWGVGRVGQANLKQSGLHRIGDIRRSDRDGLVRRFGSWGDHIWKLANAIDPRGVVPDRTAKQISHERTFSVDMTDVEMLRAVVSHLCEQVCHRLRHHHRRCKTVTLKYRREDFRTYSRSRTLATVTDSTSQIMAVAMELLAEMRQAQPRPVRLIGVSAGSLTTGDQAEQMSLFELTEDNQSQQKVDSVVDELADRLGRDTVYRATSHDWIHRKKEES